MSGDIILVIVVGTALAFDFTNGFHDTANVVATSISTRAIGPQAAIAWRRCLNFVGAFISLKVAATIGKGFVETHAVTTHRRVRGADRRDRLEPAHLVLRSAVELLARPDRRAGRLRDRRPRILSCEWRRRAGKLIVPGILAPVVAFFVAGISILLIYRIVGRLRPGPVSRGFRLGQLASGGLLSLSHGTNDAQKTMGVITLALIAHGNIPANHFHVPDWVVICGGERDLAGHVHGRLANHQDARHPHHQHGSGARIRGSGRRRRGHPRGLERRLSLVDHARDLRRDHRRRRRQTRLRGQLGRGREHRRRLGTHVAGSRDLWRDLSTRSRSLFGTGALGPIVITAALLVVLAGTFARRVQQATPAPIAS